MKSRDLIIAGVTVDVCVHITVGEAMDRCVDCLILAHATAAATRYWHYFAPESAQSEAGIFRVVGDTETLSQMLYQSTCSNLTSRRRRTTAQKPLLGISTPL
jgi:nicotinamidase-related amidase